MIEVIIGSAKYGFEEIEHIVLKEKQGEVKAWISLKINISPPSGQLVTVDKTDQLDHFVGQVQSVTRQENGGCEIFCIGVKKVGGVTNNTKGEDSKATPSNKKKKQRKR